MTLSSMLDTVGIEIESIALPREEIGDILASFTPDIRRMFRIDRDASVEFRASRISRDGRVFINSHTRAARELPIAGPNFTSGYEVTTVPLTIKEVEKAVWNFIPAIACRGDFVHERASLHVHIGYGYSIKILKRITEVGLKVEPLFYRLAGMGRSYRGERNSSIYARPLNNGPTVRGDDGYYYRIFNPESAIKSKTVTEFFSHYGIDPGGGDVQRYHPGRYFALNLYSLLLHGTLEFRYSNQTLRPLLALGMIKFYRAFAETVMYCDNDFINKLPNLSTFQKYEDSVYENMLGDMFIWMRENGIESLPNNKECDVILQNLYDTPHHNLTEQNTLSHIYDSNPDFRLRSSYIRTGKFERVDKPQPAGNIDIHNIREFSIIGDQS